MRTTFSSSDSLSLRRGVPAAAAVCTPLLLCFLLATSAWGAELQVLRGHVPAAAASLQSAGALPASTQLKLAIALPLRNQEALTKLLRELYDPASPQYLHYLTPEQFAEQFGPTEQDYQAVAAFAKANGLAVSGTHPNRVLLDVSGPAEAIEKALHVRMQTYAHPTESRTFYAPDSEPSLDLAVQVLHISGLDNYALPRPRLQARPLLPGQTATPNAGSGPSGAYMGNDFRAAYVPDSTLDGAGQVVGLLQFDGYSASDTAYYETKAGLPSVTLSNVLIDGASGHPSGGGGEVEVSLDIEMAISMAPGLSKVMVYMAPNPSPFEDLLNRMATDNVAKQLSCSWYMPRGGANPATDLIFQQMAAQGQSFFNASGDYDAYTGLIDFPGDTPYITQVGGTTLTTSGPGGAWVSETVWNWGNGIGSGGGVSTYYPIPDWQSPLDLTIAQGSSVRRNTPDVALTADNVYVRANARDYNVGGTSCAAPLWAGYMALVNQRAVQASRPTVGFVNPAVYAIGRGPSYTAAFRDTTTGSNTRSGSPTKYYAVTGYDLCTGWGTPAGSRLITALATPDPLVVIPGTGFAAYGLAGGPFNVTSQSYVLTNAGTAALDWSLSNTSLWLSASSTGGTLTPGGAAASVTVSLNAAASNLVAGAYSATVWFTNLSDSVGQSLDFSLAVLTAPTITNPPVDLSVLGGAAATFSVGAAGSPPFGYHWLRNGASLSDGGNLFGTATSTLTVSNVGLADLASYSVVVTNAVEAVTSDVAVLSMRDSMPVIVSQPADQITVVGRTATFSIGLQGTPPFTYQWNFDGTNLPGATAVPLSLTNVQFAQAGTYSVTVSNQFGGLLSSNALLTVLPAPPCASPSPSMVSWWQAEGDGTDFEDANDAQLINGVSFVAGMVGQAFSLNGVNQYVSIPDSPSLRPSSVTLEGWFNFSAATGTRQLIGKPYGSGTADSYNVWYEPGQLLAYITTSSGAGPRLSYSWTPVVGTWHHIAYTFDAVANTQKLYLDGVAVVTGAVTGPIVYDTHPLLLGAEIESGVLSYYFKGLIDEVSICSSALSAADIQAIYNADFSGKCPVALPPTIVLQPTNQTALIGGSAIFSVVAQGTRPLNYQWKFNGTNLSGASGSSLVLTNIQGGDGGTYAVLVSNGAGSVSSSNAVLTINLSSPCFPPPSGLASWWRAEGNGSDYIGTNNAGLSNGVSFASGEVGQAFKLDGVNQYLSIPDAATLRPSRGTVEGWFNFSTASGTRQLIGKPYGSGTDDSYNVWYEPGHLLAYVTTTGGAAARLSYSWTPPLGTWHHIAYTFDTATGAHRLYLDGGVVAAGTYSGPIVYDSHPLLLGADVEIGSLSYFFNGLIDEASVYARPLDTNEVQAIYNAGPAGKCANSAPPTIVLQPTNQTVSVGGLAVFNVVATGSDPISYQWRRNGTNILGASTSALLVPNAQLSDAGTYAVFLSNSVGLILSSNAVLTVIPASDCVTPPADLVSWWRAEGDGRDTLGANNGGLSNGVSFVAGEVGQAFSLNGVNQYVSVPDSSSLRPTNVTIEAWINFGATTGTRQLIGKPYGSGTADSYNVWYEPGQLLAYISRASGAGARLSYAWTPAVGTWHHVAFTFDSASSRQVLYLDGVAVAAGTVAGPIVYDTHPVLLGAEIENGGLSYFFNGRIDETSLYSRALSTNEIAAIYNAGPAGKCVIYVPPTIVTQPTNLTVNVGDTATFRVVATGLQPLNYQWRLEGTNLSGATANSLTLLNVQLAQAGNYSVFISNSIGTVLSSNALLTVNQPACTAPPIGMVSWWRGEGSASDALGANNGFLSNGVSFVSGKVGQAFSLNGVSQYISMPASASLQPSSVTIEGWFNFASASGTRQLIGKPYGTGTADSYNVWYQPGQLLAYITTPSGAGPVLSFSWTPVLGTWHHIAYTFDGVANKQVLYLDGVAVTSGTVTGPIVYDNHPVLLEADIEVGAYSYFFNGLIDEVSLYARALATNELQAIYAIGAQGKCVVPVAPYLSTQPATQTVLAGNDASFGVVTAGSQPIDYQWRFNGTNLTGQTGSTLTIIAAQTSNAGTYSVSATNVAGSALSSNAVLTVIPVPPCATPGLVDWWAAEGNANDTMGIHNGTLNGVTFTNGEVGQAFSFNGTSGYVDLGNWFTSQVFSVAMWVKPTVSQGGYADIIDNNHYASPDQSWAVEYDASGTQPSWQLFCTSGYKNIPFTLASDTWQYLVLTLDSNELAQVSVNGVVVASLNLGAPIIYNGTQFLRLGRWGSGGRYFKGALDEVDVYDHPLSMNEIISLYVAGSAGKCGIPVAPVITAQPAPQTVFAGYDARFNVVAVGAQPLSYQWRLNGTNLIGQSTSALAIIGAQVANAGSYSVLVTNAAGSTVSSNALLTVNAPPPCATPGLVDWWAAEGNANDTMGLHNGTLNGVTFTNGEVGQAFSFNGTSGYVDLGGWFTSQVFSVAMWVKPAAAQGAYADIIDNNHNASPDQGWAIEYNAFGTQPSWQLFCTSGFKNIPFNLASNTWQYLVLTLNSNELAQVSVNGVVVASLNLGAPIIYDGTQFLRLGRWGSGGRFFKGALDEIDVYYRPLSTNEIIALYNAGSVGKCGLNHPPTASNINAATKENQAMSISLEKLLQFASDPDGDVLSVSSVSGSTNGGTVLLTPSVVTYSPATNHVGADRYTFTVSDGRGGSASAYVLVTVRPGDVPSGNMLPVVQIPGGYQVSFLGLPGYGYRLQRSASLNGPWLTLGTVTADGTGLGVFTDTNAPPAGAFYRTVYP